MRHMLGGAFMLAVLLAACGDREAALPPPVADSVTVRTVEQGTLVGFSHPVNEAHVWRGVPFAAPPVGDLRWRAPRPAAGWEGTRESLSHGTWCTQIRGRLDDGSSADAIPVGEIMGGEDCLYLDVYAPKMTAEAAASAKLPVMMWIHGGSNVWGRAEQYDPSAFVAKENVIVAVVQYRLGPMGWFAHEALRESAATPDDASANFAILDQIGALGWLAENAARFGGDPGNVTIFGESAGGHDVATLLASPRAAGKFHKAIIQSGSFRSVTLEEAETGSSQASGPISQILVGDKQTAEALRAVPVEAIYDAYAGSKDTEDWEPPRIIEDGIIVPEGGLMAAISNPETFNAVPVITGTNRDETKLFNLLDDRLVRWRFGRIPKARNEALYEAVADYQSRMWRVSAVDDPARAMTAGGHGEVYAYRFDWDEAGKAYGADFAKLFGAAHSIEIPFVFGQFRFLGDADKWIFTGKNEPGRLALSSAVMAYWAEFARTGAPGNGGEPGLATWQAWSSDAAVPNILILDSPADGGARLVASQETARSVAADLFADPFLVESGLTCTVYAATAYWNPDLAAHNAGACPGPQPAASGAE